MDDDDAIDLNDDALEAGGVIGAPYLDGRQHLAFPEPPHAR